jgi:hypothetical protein
VGGAPHYAALLPLRDEGVGGGSFLFGRHRCNFNCKLLLSEANALAALYDRNCSNAVDGGTGAAAVILDASIYNQTNSAAISAGDLLPLQNEGVTIQGGNLGATTTVTSADKTTTTSTAGSTVGITGANGQGQSIWVGASITINSNPAGGFLQQTTFSSLGGYSNATLQAITVLHELGHAASIIGSPGGVGPDFPEVPGPQGVQDSMNNTQLIASSCFPK